MFGRKSYKINESVLKQTTYVLYYIPPPGVEATKYECKTFTSAKDARAARRIASRSGIKIGIHAGTDHPDPLPFGETLWR